MIELYQEYKKRAEAALEKYLPEVVEGYAVGRTPKNLVVAMRYSALSGGKRVRAALIYGCVDALGGNPDDADPFAAAIEMIHAYSLIHDDLPCMDDDDMRRGQPSCHKAFGEATALLAGDALLSQAAQVMAGACVRLGERGAKAMLSITEACGAQGMVAGQTLDMEFEDGTAQPDDKKDFLHIIHMGKTAALFKGCCLCAGHISNASQVQLHALAALGESVGLAFQAADDLLDITGDEQGMGKRVNKDAAKGKLTHPSLMGIEEAKIRLEGLARDAHNALIALPDPFLHFYIDMLTQRAT